MFCLRVYSVADLLNTLIISSFGWDWKTELNAQRIFFPGLVNAASKEKTGLFVIQGGLISQPDKELELLFEIFAYCREPTQEHSQFLLH